MKKLVLMSLLFSLSFASYSQNYLFSDFTEGTIYYKGETAVKHLMNYNVLTNRMLISEKDKKKSIPNFFDIEYVSLGKAKYIMIEAASDFGEVLVDGSYASLAARYVGKVVCGSTANALSKDKLNKMLEAGEKLPEGVKIKYDSTFYLVRQKGSTKKIHLAQNKSEEASLRGFLKIFPKQKEKITAYISENSIDFANLENVKKLLLFCDNLVD